MGAMHNMVLHGLYQGDRERLLTEHPEAYDWSEDDPRWWDIAGRESQGRLHQALGGRTRPAYLDMGKQITNQFQLPGYSPEISQYIVSLLSGQTR